jgi:hypothetical protein
MHPILIPIIVVTAFWLVVGGIGPFFAKGPNKEYFFLFFVREANNLLFSFLFFTASLKFAWY